MIIRRRVFSNPFLGVGGSNSFQDMKKESFKDLKSFVTGKPKDNGRQTKFKDLFIKPKEER